MKYYVTANGIERECPPESVRFYFELIENLTGLDRAMAAMIMRSGQRIEHPIYSFRSSMAEGSSK
jgi:hypothetical protein